MKPKWIITIGAIVFGLVLSATCWGQDVIVTEVMINPANDTAYEYLELYNRGKEPVDLNGFFFHDKSITDIDPILAWDACDPGNPNLGIKDSVIQPRGYVLVMDLSVCDYLPFALDVPLNTPITLLMSCGDYGLGAYGFANSGETVALCKDSTCKEPIDGMSAFWPVPDSAEGRSIERLDINLPDTEDNWSINCKDPVTSSPGAPSAGYTKDEAEKILGFVNKATLEELVDVKYIGEVKAQAIIDARPIVNMLALWNISGVACQIIHEGLYAYLFGLVIEVDARVVPRSMNVNSMGVFKVFLTIPEDVSLETLDPKTAQANGVFAINVEPDEEDHLVILTFDRVGFPFGDGEVLASIDGPAETYSGTASFKKLIQ